METGEFLGFILAIIGIVMLGFFGAKIYNFFVEQEMKNAQAFVNGLAEKADLLENGENNTFALRGVKEWILVSWNKDIPIAKDGEIIGKDRKPQKCFEKSCLCLCEGSDSNCQENGYCKAIETNVSVMSEYKFILSPGVFSTKSDSVPCYIMPAKSQLLEFYVGKNSSGLLIIGPIGYVSNYDDGQLVKNSCTKLGRELSFS